MSYPKTSQSPSVIDIMTQPLCVATTSMPDRLLSARLCINTSVLSNPQSSHRLPSVERSHSATIIMMLLVCGDVDPNPGPPTAESAYPWGSCECNVSWTHKALCCDRCDIWYHHSCISITSGEYLDLGNASDSWYCYRCNSHNVESFTYH